MALIGNTVEEKIWNFLNGKLNDYAAAAAMGHFFAESGLNPKNLQNTFESKLGLTDEAYTAKVDDGSYANFVKDGAGYGLVQWTYWSRKQGLLEYAKSSGASIGDLEMQLNFFWKEIQGYKSVMDTLKNAASVLEASNAILHGYEKPADQSAAAEQKRAGYGQIYYDKYVVADASGDVKSMTEKQIRQVHVNVAVEWIGCKESDGTHKQIIDIYNGHKPLARGYAVKYTDAWCATFGSAVAIKAGNDDIVPLECGCGQFIEIAKAMGIWVENDAYVPDIGDYILYDWQDGTNYATTDNTGWPDHIGIVEKVSGSAITVIEGNMNDAVGRRSLQVNGRYIRGYVCPKYASKAAASGSSAEETSSSGYKVGEIIQFSGSRHYTSANATTAKSCKPGPAKITDVSDGAKHPYHIIHTDSTSNVYGWVDTADIGISAAAGGTVSHTVVKGDTLSTLAKKYGSTVEKIVAANQSKYPKLTANYIVIGWTLTIPQ